MGRKLTNAERITKLEYEIAYRRDIIKSNRAAGRPVKRSTLRLLDRHVRQLRVLTERGES